MPLLQAAIFERGVKDLSSNLPFVAVFEP